MIDVLKILFSGVHLTWMILRSLMRMNWTFDGATGTNKNPLERLMTFYI